MTTLRLFPEERFPPVRVLSYGGGLDSFAMLLLAIKQKQLPEVAIFADVTDPERKDPGEWPGTYSHIREVVMPICEQRGIEFVWLDTTSSPIRGHRSLMQYFESKTMMFTRMSRVCTVGAKVERIVEYLTTRYVGRDLEVSIGFEAGEEVRAKKDPHGRGRPSKEHGIRRVNVYPLMEAGMCRCACEAMVRETGLPVPRKSACVFCPSNSRGDWLTLKAELPGEFRRAARLEERSKLTGQGIKLRFSGEPEVPLEEWIHRGREYKRKEIVCGVCGEIRASKAVGCDYLDEDE
jgi:hypothetical protein